MNPEIQAILKKVQAILDKARADADAADKVVNSLDSDFIGKLLTHAPVIGNYATTAVTLANVLDEALDALDGVIDSYANPGVAPALPQVQKP